MHVDMLMFFNRSPVKLDDIVVKPSAQDKGRSDVLFVSKTKMACVRKLYAFNRQFDPSVKTMTVADVLACQQLFQTV